MINLREWALLVYTILMQLSGGAFFLLWITRVFLRKKMCRTTFDEAVQNIMWILLLTIVTSLVGSHFHLSRPYHSFLAILNFAHSWLSREILFNLIFLFLVSCLCWIQVNKPHAYTQKDIIGWAAILMAGATIFSMANIYNLATQPVWQTISTFSSFLASALLLGVMALTSLLVMDFRYAEMRDKHTVEIQKEIICYVLPWFTSIAFFLGVTMALVEFQQLHTISQNPQQAVQASFILLNRYYPVLLVLRFVLMLVGVLVLSSSVFYRHRQNLLYTWLLVPSYVACLMVMIAEILNRFLFYALHVRVGL